ncbi:MAG: hypothetical protein KIT10_15610 [Flavobacteriales bacterium]|nr:hypothetical protein [Flavobacteriales bacterium]
MFLRTFAPLAATTLLLLLAACDGGQESTNGSTPATTVASGRYTAPDDPKLVEWVKTASDEDLEKWYMQMRSSPLPADYVAPDGVTQAPDQRSVLEEYRVRHAEVNGLLAAGNRNEVLRTHILDVRQSIYDSKAAGGQARQGTTLNRNNSLQPSPSANSAIDRRPTSTRDKQ